MNCGGIFDFDQKKRRLVEVSGELESPDVWNDPKRAQELGFTLSEVANLLALEDGRNCREARELARRKLGIVEARLADLNRLRKTLRALIAQCDLTRGRVSCPLISALSAGRR